MANLRLELIESAEIARIDLGRQFGQGQQQHDAPDITLQVSPHVSEVIGRAMLYNPINLAVALRRTQTLRDSLE